MLLATQLDVPFIYRMNKDTAIIMQNTISEYFNLSSSWAELSR